jgi:hypothetical protein
MPRDERATPWIVELYDRHGAALYRYAVMLLADPAAAADAGYSVYSVGPNGTDDRGDLKRTFGRERGWESADVGIRIGRP